MNKYKNKKCEFDGVKFDSLVERARYIDLLDMYKRGEISYLAVQPRFLLFDKFERNGKKHRAIHYIADFHYTEEIQDFNGNCFDVTVIEDVKGMKTAVYKLKLKRFLFLNPLIIFREVKLVKNKWEILEL